jgi:hypothetical protein
VLKTLLALLAAEATLITASLAVPDKSGLSLLFFAGVMILGFIIMYFVCREKK